MAVIDATTREICKICHHVNAVGFHVHDELWRDIVPPAFRDEVVCLECFGRLGDERGIAWEGGIELFPVSLATHIARCNNTVVINGEDDVVESIRRPAREVRGSVPVKETD